MNMVYNIEQIHGLFNESENLFFAYIWNWKEYVIGGAYIYIYIFEKQMNGAEN
jgi:hypothetical protein